MRISWKFKNRNLNSGRPVTARKGDKTSSGSPLSQEGNFSWHLCFFLHVESVFLSRPICFHLLFMVKALLNHWVAYDLTKAPNHLVISGVWDNMNRRNNNN